MAATAAEDQSKLFLVPRPPDLPDYSRPPIDEVAIGLQLQGAIPGFTDAHAGLFWRSVRDRYVTAESQPRIESQPENLEGPQIQPFPFPIFAGPQGGRTFLVSDDESYLLQIQSNRFYRNWRRREDDYPHFDDLAASFREEYAAFSAFLAEENLASPPALQFEVAYINWIPDLPVRVFLRAGDDAHVDVAGLDEWPEDQSWTARYLSRDSAGVPLARLHVQCVPALRMSPSGPLPGAQMSLAFLSPSRGSASIDDELQEILTMARNAIVHGFTCLTTPSAHEHWGRIQ